jgi:hypothetical protein
MVNNLRLGVAAVAMDDMNNHINNSGDDADAVSRTNTAPVTTTAAAAAVTVAATATTTATTTAKQATEKQATEKQAALEKARLLTLTRIVKSKRALQSKIDSQSKLERDVMMKKKLAEEKKVVEAGVKKKKRAEIYAINSVMRIAFEEKYNDFCANMMTSENTHCVVSDDVVARARNGRAGGSGVGAV